MISIAQRGNKQVPFIAGVVNNYTATDQKHFLLFSSYRVKISMRREKPKTRLQKRESYVQAEKSTIRNRRRKERKHENKNARHKHDLSLHSGLFLNLATVPNLALEIIDS